MTPCAAVALLLLPPLPQSAALDSDERVQLYPTAAALAADGRSWRVPVHFCVYEPEEGDPLRAAALAPLRGMLSVEEGSAEAALFAARARLFLVDHERRKHVDVAVGELRFRLGPTAADGRFEGVIEVPAALAAELAVEGRLPLSIANLGRQAPARGAACLVPPEGLSVISDLDDTIKVTGVGDKRAALENTFLREFEAVAGMAELYRRLAERGAAFHYVSLSPWQLAAPLEEFLARERFPGGSLHLQPFRVQDGDFGDLVGDSREKKLAAIGPLLRKWPMRRFVLIGDSSQVDPEVYAEIARRHPGRVASIWIRDVAAAAGEGSEAQRFARAVEGLEGCDRQLFTDPGRVETAAAR